MAKPSTKNSIPSSIMINFLNWLIGKGKLSLLMKKRCPRCHRPKDTSEFRKGRAICKPCENAKRREQEAQKKFDKGNILIPLSLMDEMVAPYIDKDGKTFEELRKEEPQDIISKSHTPTSLPRIPKYIIDGIKEMKHPDEVFLKASTSSKDTHVVIEGEKDIFQRMEDLNAHFVISGRKNKYILQIFSQDPPLTFKGNDAEKLMEEALEKKDIV